MSITKYTNFEQIDSRKENKGNFLLKDDLLIVSKTEIEEADFGDCKHDVMEVSIYDVNNVLLPNKTGNNIAYLKPNDIKNYMYDIVNAGGQKELAINVEKLLNDLGYSNGILKVNLNFVRNKIGTDNDLTRVWIQEISPSREEVRIVPLKTKDNNINNITKSEFKNIHNLSKDFKYYKKNILDALDKFETNSLTVIDDALVAKFGNDFRSVLRKDFGLRDLDSFHKRIFENFRDSIKNWVGNRYYDVSQSTFGKPSEMRFESCGQYDFNMLLGEIQSILNNCIQFNTKALQRRQVDIKQLPKEFGIVELRKQIQNNLDSFGTKIDIKRNIYMPDKADVTVTGTSELPPIKTVKEVTVVENTPAPTPPPAPLTTPAPSAPSEVAYEYVLSNYHPTDNRTFILRQLGTNGVISYILSPGQERTVCAIENSVSVAEGGYGNINKRSVCGTTPTNSSQITPTTQTKPNLQDTAFSTAAQQEIGLGVGGGGGSTRYVPAGLNGTNSNYNGFDTTFSNVENDPTGRDY
jgi:hypothetical protein